MTDTATPSAAAPAPPPADSAPGPTATTTRQRNPVYAVLELVEVDRDGEPIKAWVLLGEEISADSDKDAIKQATADRPEDERKGTFWAPLQSNFRPRKRGQNVTVEDTWE